MSKKRRLGIGLAAGALVAAMVPGVVQAIEDTTPPQINCESVSPDTLWPSNHRLVEVTVTVSATDNVDPSPTLELVSVTSNEPDNGLGDGNTVDDVQGWDIGTPDKTGLLRAEHAAGGSGRVYTLEYRATDASGNTASCSLQVSVPHGRRPS